jgi:hypothetical protein
MFVLRDILSRHSRPVRVALIASGDFLLAEGGGHHPLMASDRQRARGDDHQSILITDVQHGIRRSIDRDTMAVHLGARNRLT